MNRLVDLVAPRTWGGVVAKSLLVMVAIHALNAAGAWTGVFDYTPSDAVATTLLGWPPFLVLMAMMKHLKRLQGELAVLATTDLLTGLPNRRAFLARTAEAAGGRPGALLLLDADHFKRVNDTFGHAVGDACLAAIGRHLRDGLRPGDVVGRLGGEEFSAFLPGADRAAAEALGERLCQAVAVEAEGIEARLRVTLSIGAALGEGRTPIDLLMARADAALYRAKAEGRGRVVFWSDADASPRTVDRAA